MTNNSRPTQHKQGDVDAATTSVGVAVVEHRGSYLVGIRSGDGPLPGLAEFPGGKVEFGESPRECAVRECLEETGLRVSAERMLFKCTHAYPHGLVELEFWLCRPLMDQPAERSQEFESHRWAPLQELNELHFPEANRPVIEQLSSQRDL